MKTIFFKKTKTKTKKKMDYLCAVSLNEIIFQSRIHKHVGLFCASWMSFSFVGDLLFLYNCFYYFNNLKTGLIVFFLIFFALCLKPNVLFPILFIRTFFIMRLFARIANKFSHHDCAFFFKMENAILNKSINMKAYFMTLRILQINAMFWMTTRQKKTGLVAKRNHLCLFTFFACSVVLVHLTSYNIFFLIGFLFLQIHHFKRLFMCVFFLLQEYEHDSPMKMIGYHQHSHFNDIYKYCKHNDAFKNTIKDGYICFRNQRPKTLDLLFKHKLPQAVCLYLVEFEDTELFQVLN